MPRPDPTKAIDVVLPDDPNLDLSEMDIGAYQETADEALIRDKSETCKAARFRLVPITDAYLQRIENAWAAYQLPAKHYEAFLASVRSVTLSNGQVLKAPLRTLTIGQTKQQVATEAWALEIKRQFGQNAIRFPGRIAFERACAPQGDADPT